jgi:phosphate transport system permease protein
MAEAKPKQDPFATTGRSRLGEPFVWLCAGGLAVGVSMALGLLLLITLKGMASFWPRHIERYELNRGEEVVSMAGYVAQETERRGTDGEMHEELQLFRGNRGIEGESFVFFDRADIRMVEQPEGFWWIERLEGGPGILELQALVSPSGRTEASEAKFQETLNRMIRDGDATRAALLDIERKRMGKVSRTLEQLARDERAGKAAAADLEGQRAELQKEFESLQAEVAALRGKLAETKLIGKTASGREVQLDQGQVLSTFAPNQASWFSRVGEMFRRIWSFLTDDPREANTDGGVFPAIFGTVVMTLVMSLFVTPFGVIAAIYLREYARQGLLVRFVRISVNNLAGVPSIVFGVFGLAFFVYTVGGSLDRWFFADTLPTPTYGTPGILWASLTLALLTLPVVIVATEEAIAAVPRGVREAALACGASKWQTIQRVVLPASLPGILTGVILAMARGAGEVAPLMLVGVVKLAPSLPLDDIAPFIHPERKFMHLGFHIYDLGFQSPDAEAAKPVVYATALLLIVVVVALNLTAISIRNHLRKKFAVSSF